MSLSSWEDTAEKLTQQAFQAAEEGRWDGVEIYYRRRGDLFRSKAIPPLLAQQLHIIDSRVYKKLCIVTSATKYLLSEVSSKQRVLNKFTSVDGSTSARVSRRM